MCKKFREFSIKRLGLGDMEKRGIKSLEEKISKYLFPTKVTSRYLSRGGAATIDKFSKSIPAVENAKARGGRGMLITYLSSRRPSGPSKAKSKATCKATSAAINIPISLNL